MKMRLKRVVNNRVEKFAVFSKGFRGVPNGWHHLKSCNFLVGENSSGKSSFLQLLEIVDSRNHMLFFDVCGIVKGLDTAIDICSRRDDSKEVTIGEYFIEKGATSGRAPNKFGRLASYKEVGGELKLQRLTIVSRGKVLRLKRRGNEILYRADDLPYDEERDHAANCAEFEAAHFLNGRFKRVAGDAPEGAPDFILWNDGIRAATGQSGAGSNFFQGRPALGCLHYGPMRAQAQRLYHGASNEFSSSGEHIAYLLKDALEEDDVMRSALEKFGRESGLFDRISVSSVKTKIKDKPFTIQVEKAGAHFYVDELGYGVGQILPIVSDIVATAGGNGFLIEQPELHLHPRAQAALGDVFLKATSSGAVLIVETHSDFLIDRFRMRRKEYQDELGAQIMYFSRAESGENVCHEIEILDDGALTETPEGYRSFFMNESIDKIGALL